MSKNKFFLFILKHIHEILFVLFALLLEYFSVLLMTKKFYIINPIPLFIFLGVLLLIGLIIKNKTAELIYFAVMLMVIGVGNIALQNGFFLQGEAVFKIEQLTFMDDGLGIVSPSSLYLNWFYIIMLFVFSLSFVAVLFIKKVKDFLYTPKPYTKTHLILGICTTIMLPSFLPLMLVSSGYQKYDYQEYRKGYENSLNKYGVLGNFLLEVVGQNNKPIKLSSDYLNEHKTIVTSNNTTSVDKNLIVILVETFEWWGFIQDSEKFPNGLQGFSQNDLESLFPNLYRLYNGQAIVGENHYVKDKTNETEGEIILGSIPFKNNFNDFNDVDYYFGLPKMFKEKYPEAITQYFHNNKLKMYDRFSYISSFGFEKVYGEDEILALDNYNYDRLEYQTATIAESMITDSSFILNNKEIMFPLDKQFFTFWLTLTMHSPYDFERAIFADNKAELLSKTNVNLSNEVINYCISVMDFDKSLGIIFDYLQENNLLETTTIVFQGDHNAYMGALSNTVKNVTNDNAENNRLPLFIYDKDLQSDDLDLSISSTYSLVPTLLELFDIPYIKEMYINDSLFREDKIVYLYSYAYSFFIDKYGLFNSLKGKMTAEELDNREKVIDCFVTRQGIIDNYYYYQKVKN
ncbi:MAG: sulfatase-like hydrolase/transferase [Bacillales bacterium]|jgi:phosphoglycerol transferase MdoB-like AlkP superfamily enzyme|nr:sulfatase-like hydrolase/transferase [Bacillales bacterium]